jgi:imidazolonepropionase-like amidohydrolase
MRLNTIMSVSTMSLRHQLALLWLVCVALCFSASASDQPQSLALVHVNVIPMNRDGVLEDQTVVVRDGKITQVGPSQKVRIPKGTRRIEAGGEFLIPGLTDAHVHLLSPTEFSLYLASGVTTVFNLNGRPAHLLWRKQVASGALLGPTVFTAGPTFDRPHTAEEAVRMVDEQAALGYDAVKIYNQVSKAEYPALIAEAKRKNMLLMGHVARQPEFELTIQSGQSIAHLEEFTYTYFNPLHDDNNSHIVYDESKIPDVVRETAKSGVYVIPTLYTYRDIVEQATNLEQFLKNPELKYVAPWTLVGLQPAANRYYAFPPKSHAQLRTSLAFQRKLVKALADAGVPLLSGTDATDIGPVAGFGLHDELQELVHDGLTPYQALQTATTNAARYFKRANEFGTIEPGKRADMVLLDRNPLIDISNTRRIDGVMVRGRWLATDDISKMLGSVAGEYARQEKQVEQDLQADPKKAQQYLAEHDPFDRLAGAAIFGLASTQGVASVKQVLVKLRQEDPNSTLASEESINNLGYALIAQKKYAEAVAFLQMNTEDFPKSANACDSYAEALFDSGDVAHAVDTYKKALEIDPKYGNAEFAQKFLAEHSQAK